MINWKVRIKNKNFWFAIIPAVALLIQAIATLLGFTLDLSDFSGKMLVVVDCVFVVLAILGIVNDPTTTGISDSSRAMTYDEPKNY